MVSMIERILEVYIAKESDLLDTIELAPNQ
jgi:hypothetical protein